MLLFQDDLYSLDSATLETLKPIHALIFLFKYVGREEGGGSNGVEVDPLESGVWFANQVSPSLLMKSEQRRAELMCMLGHQQ